MAKSKKNNSVTETDANRLVSMLAKLMTKDDLLTIAAYDYGSDIPQHYEALNAFKNTLESKHLKSWYPLEVMELCRWDNLHDSETKKHTRRAFCCAGMLSKWFDSPEKYDIITPLDAVGPLADSLCYLDSNLFEALEKFLTFGLSKLSYIEHVVALELGKLFAYLKMGEQESLIKEQLSKTLKAETEVFEMWGLNFPLHIEITKFANESVISSACYKLSVSIREIAATINHVETRENLTLLAERLKRCD